jgi:hypothetical protein
VARDLREWVAIQLVMNELERMGDYALLPGRPFLAVRTSDLDLITQALLGELAFT